MSNISKLVSCPSVVPFSLSHPSPTPSLPLSLPPPYLPLTHAETVLAYAMCAHTLTRGSTRQRIPRDGARTGTSRPTSSSPTRTCTSKVYPRSRRRRHMPGHQSSQPSHTHKTGFPSDVRRTPVCGLRLRVSRYGGAYQSCLCSHNTYHEVNGTH